MNDTDKTRFQRALDLIEWLDLRVAQRVEQQVRACSLIARSASSSSGFA
jgi:hypothetical protein